MGRLGGRIGVELIGLAGPFPFSWDWARGWGLWDFSDGVAKVLPALLSLPDLPVGKMGRGIGVSRVLVTCWGLETCGSGSGATLFAAASATFFFSSYSQLISNS